MKFLRIFSAINYKGTKEYINSQKKYEVIRTLIYFGISMSLFIAGYVTTKTKINLLTVVAILGCLPACKSLVGMIMFFRFKSLPKEAAEIIEKHAKGLETLYDMVFTTYDKIFNVGHVTLRGNTVVCYSCQKNLDETACIKHLTETLALDGISGVTFKVFDDVNKYTQRLEQLKSLEDNEKLNDSVKQTLLSIAL